MTCEILIYKTKKSNKTTATNFITKMYFKYLIDLAFVDGCVCEGT